MKKLISIVLSLFLLTFTACQLNKEKTKGDSNTNESSLADSIVAIENEQAKSNALKFIPSQFDDALMIETARQDAILNGSSVDQDNATQEAFNKMKTLYNTYCEKVKSKLDDNQKKLFNNLLEEDLQYSIVFDMFSHNVLQQYVYTNGNAACNEDYNILRLKTIMMFNYYNILNGDTIASMQGIIDENFNSFFFFNTKTKYKQNQSIEESVKIADKHAPLLKKLLDKNSQSVLDTYDKSFKGYISVLEAFDKSLNNSSQKIEVISVYKQLNTAFIYSLYDIIKDMEYPKDMFEMFNLNLDKNEYILKWN